MHIVLRVAVLLCAPAALIAQTAPPATAASSSEAVATLVVRQRTMATQWFAATPSAEQYGQQDSLVRIGIAQRVRRFDYAVELGQSAELWLRSDAVSPVAAQGQLGLGGSYYAANGGNRFPAAASFRQGFVRYNFAQNASAVRLGRFEFIEGQETSPRNATLQWVQANRVAQRLVGNFGFSTGQRSFDGVDLKLEGKGWDLTAMGGRAIQGVFNMNANPELNVDIQYVAYTRSLAHGNVLARGFGLAYHDGRTGVLKTDNRPAGVRALDHRNIRVGTYGADVIAAVPMGKVTADLMVWAALQNGAWGVLQHSANAFAAEGGLKLNVVRSQPWLRGGYLRTSGDRDNADGVHNTFFQVLPTARVYARFPFFNSMNSTDAFVQCIDRPTARLEVRSDLHFLALTSGNDLWYQGGGAFDNKVFGYVGRPGNGHSSFSSLYDVGADYALNKHFSVSTYFGHSFGKTVVAAIYPRSRDANFGFFELTYKLQKPL